MSLIAADEAYLVQRGHTHNVSDEAGMTCVVFPEWKLPQGLDRENATLLIRLPAGFPDVPPDMWWFDPAVHRANGGIIQGTEAVEVHLGRQWQRWSRHFQAGQWRSGVDGLESYLALIQRDLVKAAAA
jgi:hypothetical protein